MDEEGDVMISNPKTNNSKANNPLFIGTIVLLVVVIGAILVYWLKPEWTGFNEHIGPTVQRYEQYQPGKKLWDWLQFFIIPAVLAIGGFSFNHIQREREERAKDERDVIEKQTAAQRDQIAANNQHQATLQAYIDKLSELILEKKLLNSGIKDDDDELERKRKQNLRTVASVQTLTALSHLDSKRRKSVIQFLNDLNLIYKEDSVINLSGADLREVDLSEIDLSDTDLRGANLSGARLNGTNLSRTNLSGANLSDTRLFLANLRDANLIDSDLIGADLIGADLSDADLSGTDLSGADLIEANLIEANLSGAPKVSGQAFHQRGGAKLIDADLSGANLSGANLKDASVNIEMLKKQAGSLQNAIMPDGTTHS